MPSKPLFGMPVAVGISDAVIAMRSMVSLAAGDASANEAVNAKAIAGRNDMRALLCAADALSNAQQEAGQRIAVTLPRAPRGPLTNLQADCIRFAPFSAGPSSPEVRHAHFRGVARDRNQLVLADPDQPGELRADALLPARQAPRPRHVVHRPPLGRAAARQA